MRAFLVVHAPRPQLAESSVYAAFGHSLLVCACSMHTTLSGGRLRALKQHVLTADVQRLRRGVSAQVLALAPDAGIIQFVDNTQSLGEYLVGSGAGGAHERYRLPGGMTHPEARQRIGGIQAEIREPKRRGEWLPVYREVCEAIPPVMHRFFSERYRSAALWCAPACALRNLCSRRAPRVCDADEHVEWRSEGASGPLPHCLLCIMYLAVTAGDESDESWSGSR